MESRLAGALETRDKSDEVKQQRVRIEQQSALIAQLVAERNKARADLATADRCDQECVDALNALRERAEKAEGDIAMLVHGNKFTKDTVARMNDVWMNQANKDVLIRFINHAIGMKKKPLVHDHGPDAPKCREYTIDGRLVGECIIKAALTNQDAS